MLEMDLRCSGNDQTIQSPSAKQTCFYRRVLCPNRDSEARLAHLLEAPLVFYSHCKRGFCFLPLGGQRIALHSHVIDFKRKGVNVEQLISKVKFQDVILSAS